MLIASQKRKENIAEYLLYMWQVEDLIRANGFNIENIQKSIIDKFDQPAEVKKEMHEWYQNLINRMLGEGVKEKGHIQLNKNILIELNDLHRSLLRSAQETAYGGKFYQILPYLTELRDKSNASGSENDIELCFNALYGYMLLRLQRREISAETAEGIKQISSFIALLSQKYSQDKAG